MFKLLVAVIILSMTVFYATPTLANTILNPANSEVTVSKNKQTVQQYMEAFNRTDHAAILSCLTDDVEWVLPGVFHVQGKHDFASHIVDEGFTGRPEIRISRLVEESDVVVAEGSVRAPKEDGSVLNLIFCDVFDMRDGKIRRLVSYLVVTT